MKCTQTLPEVVPCKLDIRATNKAVNISVQQPCNSKITSSIGIALVCFAKELEGYIENII
jgi:hypothetical protein